jgi:hypothetical protein
MEMVSNKIVMSFFMLTAKFRSREGLLFIDKLKCFEHLALKAEADQILTR